jgi:hypothetical protein
MDIEILSMEIAKIENSINEYEVNELIMEESIQYIKNSGYGIEAVEPLLMLMERHPLVEFGMPGEIVHFVEAFYGNGYEDLLVQSVKRKPTIHTVWMLHRLINDPKGTRNNEFVSLMKKVTDRTDIDKVIANSAKAFLIG